MTIRIKRMSKRKKWILILLALFVVGVAVNVGVVEYTSMPGFCAKCHYMEPYVSSWKESKHSDVTCLKCHFPPGIKHWVYGKLNGLTEVIKTVTHREGPKPETEIEDASCLRGGCHVREELAGPILFREKYNFDHGTHFEELRGGKKLRCASCHSRITEGPHFQVSEAVCFTCHFKGQTSARETHPIGGCTSCHNVPEEGLELASGSTFVHKDFVDRGVECWKCHFDTVQGTGDVSKQVCLQCHEKQEQIDQYSDSRSMHNWHVTENKVECLNCHSEIRHGLRPEPFEKRDTCETCHTKGHTSPKEMFAGEGAKGVEEAPSMHFNASVECVACHAYLFEMGNKHLTDMKVHETIEASCQDCHGDANDGILGTWLDVFHESLDETKALLADAVKEYESATLDSKSKKQVKRLLDDAKFNCEFIEKGRGVHNPEYALDVLDKAANDIAEAQDILEDAKESAETQEAPAEAAQ